MLKQGVISDLSSSRSLIVLTGDRAARRSLECPALDSKLFMIHYCPVKNPGKPG